MDFSEENINLEKSYRVLRPFSRLTADERKVFDILCIDTKERGLVGLFDSCKPIKVTVEAAHYLGAIGVELPKTLTSWI